ncbi:MAG: zinc ribbon domain-containing protein [Gammaproteobacteria bacterium]|nr:zinc ribbon domain-containing protein [Gammaproteobacteria bacterium]
MSSQNEDEVRVSEEGTYEMLWNCQYCGTAKLLGNTHKFCPNCGGPQAPDARYFPADDEKIAVRDHEYVGADLVCPACQNPNAGNAEFCTQCGGPLTDAARSKRQADELREEGGKFAAEGAAGDAPKSDAKPESGGGSRKWLIFAVIALIVVGIGVFFFWTKQVSVELAAHSWAYEIRIEDYGPRSEKAWCDEKSRDAYDITRKREQRSERKVQDGEKCSTRRVDQGDGTYKEKRECRPKYRNEPVYSQRCYYQVDRWAHKRTEKAEAMNKNPRWPNARISRRGTCRGCEREQGRNEKYYLHFQGDKNKSYRCSVPQNQWNTAKVRSRWQLEIGAMAGDARCGTLKALK